MKRLVAIAVLCAVCAFEALAVSPWAILQCNTNGGTNLLNMTSITLGQLNYTNGNGVAPFVVVAADALTNTYVPPTTGSVLVLADGSVCVSTNRSSNGWVRIYPGSGGQTPWLSAINGASNLLFDALMGTNYCQGTQGNVRVGGYQILDTNPVPVQVAGLSTVLGIGNDAGGLDATNLGSVYMTNALAAGGRAAFGSASNLSGSANEVLVRAGALPGAVYNAQSPLVVEGTNGNGNVNISIVAGTNSSSAIHFFSTNSSSDGYVNYHRAGRSTNDYMEFYVGGGTWLSIYGNGAVWFGGEPRTNWPKFYPRYASGGTFGTYDYMVGAGKALTNNGAYQVLVLPAGVPNDAQAYLVQGFAMENASEDSSAVLQSDGYAEASQMQAVWYPARGASAVYDYKEQIIVRGPTGVTFKYRASTTLNDAAFSIIGWWK